MIDFALVVGNVIAALNATGDTDLTFWTTAQLYTYMDLASRRLGQTGAFVNLQAIQLMQSGQSYSLPNNSLSVIGVYVDGAALRASSVRDLAALSDSWADVVDVPQRFALDLLGTKLITFAPKPNTDAAAEVVYHTWPDVNSGTSRAPSALGLFLQYATLAMARGKEGEGQSMDITAAASARVSVIEQACKALWGGSQ